MIQVRGRKFRVDGCMQEFIVSLNECGVETLGCCCGHGRYPMSVVVRNGNDIFDIFSGMNIPRTRRFYITDDEGYYYLPEVI